MTQEESDRTSNQNALYWMKVYEDSKQRLIARALRLVNGRSYDADDLVQETVCRVLIYSKDHREIRNPLGYMLCTMRNIWTTKWHKENTANMESLEEVMTVKNQPTVEPDVFRILENQDLESDMTIKQGPLTPRERLLFKLHLAGWNCKEISNRLNEDVRLIRSDLNAVKSKVRQRIKRGSK